jgi:hypothetical protein
MLDIDGTYLISTVPCKEGGKVACRPISEYRDPKCFLEERTSFKERIRMICIPDIQVFCMKDNIRIQPVRHRILNLPISRMDLTPPEQSPTGHRLSSNKSAETSMAAFIKLSFCKSGVLDDTNIILLPGEHRRD